MDFRKEIKSAIDSSRLTLDSVAKQIGISKYSLSSFFSEVRKQKIGMEAFIKLVRLFFEHHKCNNLIIEYISHEPKPERIIATMEYACFYENKQLLNAVIDIAKDLKNNSLKEWVELYSLFAQFDDFNIIYEKSKLIPIKCNELKVFKQIMDINFLYRNKTYKLLDGMLNKVKNDVESLNDSYIKKCYLIRIMFFCGNVKYYLNKIDESIKIMEYLLSFTDVPIKIGHIYHTLGLNYMWRDEKLSITYLKKAFEIFKNEKNESEVKNVLNSINFVSCFSNNLEEFIIIKDKNPSNCNNLLYKYIKENNKEMSNYLVKEIEKMDLSDHNMGFFLYLKGLLYNDKSMFLRSVIYFKKCGDLVYLQLPCKKLIEIYGVDFANAVYGDFIY